MSWQASPRPLPRNLLDAVGVALGSSGRDLAGLAQDAGLSLAALESDLTPAQVDYFLCLAWAALDDPGFGLRAGASCGRSGSG